MCLIVRVTICVSRSKEYTNVALDDSLRMIARNTNTKTKHWQNNYIIPTADTPGNTYIKVTKTRICNSISNTHVEASM